MFSKPYINKMLQATSAKTLPMRLNSVRHIEPYQESVSPEDLLAFYVNDKHYPQINKALRSPDIQTATQQIWNESGVMEPKYNYPGLSDEYIALMSSLNPNLNKEIEYSIEQAKNSATNNLLYKSDKIIGSIPDKITYAEHPLAYTPDFNQLPLGTQSAKVLNYKLPNKEFQPLTLEDRYKAQQYSNQILASIPHTEQALKQRANVVDTLNQPVQRGLRFEDDNAYNSFLAQHSPGAIVDYPAFTSTTSDPIMMKAFSEKRLGGKTITQEIKPNSQNYLNAYDANNRRESEYLVPPGGRFKVTEVLDRDNSPHIIMEDATGQLTPVERRTNAILGKMKPRFANIK